MAEGEFFLIWDRFKTKQLHISNLINSATPVNSIQPYSVLTTRDNDRRIVILMINILAENITHFYLIPR